MQASDLIQSYRLFQRISWLMLSEEGGNLSKNVWDVKEDTKYHMIKTQQIEIADSDGVYGHQKQKPQEIPSLKLFFSDQDI